MKNLILIISLSLSSFVQTPLMAQGMGPGSGGGQNPEYMAQKQTEMMKERLDLTSQQIPEVYEINLKTAKKMIAFREAHRGDRTAMQKKMQELQKEKEPALKKILTDQQYEALVKYHSENPGGRGPGYGRN